MASRFFCLKQITLQFRETFPILRFPSQLSRSCSILFYLVGGIVSTLLARRLIRNHSHLIFSGQYHAQSHPWFSKPRTIPLVSYHHLERFCVFPSATSSKSAALLSHNRYRNASQSRGPKHEPYAPARTFATLLHHQSSDAAAIVISIRLPTRDHSNLYPAVIRRLDAER